MNLEAVRTAEALSLPPYTARWCKAKSKLRSIYRAERNWGRLLLLLLYHGNYKNVPFGHCFQSKSEHIPIERETAYPSLGSELKLT